MSSEAGNAAAANVRDDPFPAPSKTATGTVNGLPTEATSMRFSDTVLVTLSQEGRLTQWIQVPVSAPTSALLGPAVPGDAGVSFSSSHLTPTTLLGAGGEARETLGQLYATEIARQLLLRDLQERRTLLLGLGLVRAEASREGFFDVMELVQKVL
ncbi:hypothetical protein VTK73DRAFT_3863 [Phialemonium thermophilum]|uniref:Proteasome assembly chaperone 3 n=1 Tax=Phialemonium thermophilum TaxID=223376 RepID=A0ABR3VDT2_9PEZI